MTLSTISTTPMEEVAATGVRRWFQLYVMNDRSITEDTVRRAHANGFEALVLTVDTPYLGPRWRDVRNRFELPPEVDAAVVRNLSLHARPRRESEGPGSQLDDFFAAEHDATLAWDDLAWLRSLSPMPLVLKGVLTAEDARLAVEAGVEGIIVSNHGGRQLDGAPATLDALPEVVDAARGGAEIYLDGGIRRGTDALKALALGARAVLVGRPIVWGLAANGEEGVRAVLELLRGDLLLTMQLMGLTGVGAIDRSILAPAVRAGDR